VVFLTQGHDQICFQDIWVDLVMAIVELALFSFIINGKSSGFFRFMRGLWQGNSIYLYLFLFLIAKSLSSCYIGPFRDGVS